MKNFVTSNFFLIITLLLCSLIFINFTYHEFFVGTDEIRTTLVPCEFVNRGNIFYKDVNNSYYDTNIFVKNGFKINESGIIYPFGFISNSLINLPFFAVAGCNSISLNVVPLIVYLLTFLLLYKIFINLKLSRNLSIIGAVIFSITNYYLALYVSYYPDYILVFMWVLCVWIILKTRFVFYSLKSVILISVIISFLLAYKVTFFLIFFSAVPFYVYNYILSKEPLTRLLKQFITFSIIFSLFIIPQLYSMYIGPSYNQEKISDSGQISTEISKKPIAKIFIDDYLLPKDNGLVLFNHAKKDINFFAKNNIFTLLGFFVFLPLLIRGNKKLFTFLLLVLFTSFWFWGNMSVYGGSDTFHLRNSHIRYMLPIFILYFILSYHYFARTAPKRFLNILIFFSVLISFNSLRNDYPFSPYSLINKSGYYYGAYQDIRTINSIIKSDNSVVLSAVFDDFDISYRYKNYGDLKIAKLANKSAFEEIKKVVSKDSDPKYLLLPKTDSRYNPFTFEDIVELKAKVLNSYNPSLIYENDTMAIYKI